jgi:hypothetical protein
MWTDDDNIDRRELLFMAYNFQKENNRYSFSKTPHHAEFFQHQRFLQLVGCLDVPLYPNSCELGICFLPVILQRVDYSSVNRDSPYCSQNEP